MNNLKVLIVEDQDAEASHLKDSLLQLGFEVPAIAKNLSEGLEYFDKYTPDISLIDIYLNGRPDGIVFGLEINERMPVKKPFLFLTSAIDNSTFKLAKSTMPFNYLLKPFNKPELKYAIELANERFRNEGTKAVLSAKDVRLDSSFLFVKKGNTLVKFHYDDIRYIEVEGKYSKIVCEHEKFLVQQSLKELHTQLPSAQFHRMHRNYIVNVKEVTKLNAGTGEIYFKDGRTLIFSRRYMDEFLQNFKLFK